MKLKNYLAIFTLCLFAFTNQLFAQQSGDLDLSFGIGGVVKNTFDTTNSGFDALAIQPDGKIIAVGSVQPPLYINGRDFGLVRFNPNSSIDSSFGTDGIVITDYNNAMNLSYDVAIQLNGKIVLAGLGGVVIRYNPNGEIDTTFGGSGIVQVPLGFSDATDGNSLAIQADGKIIAVGFVGPAEDFAVVRIDTDGVLDNTFSGNGEAITDLGTDYDEAGSVILQPDGKIVAGGRIAGPGPIDFALVRYNTNGSLDTTFDQDGIVLTDFGLYSGIYSLAIQSDGKIIAAGDNGFGNYFDDFALARYNTDGTLDSSFSSDGRLTVDIKNLDVARSVLVQNNGKIIATGYSSTSDSTQHYFAMVRCTTDGSIDSSFGSNGIVTTSVDSGDLWAHDAALTPTGDKILVAGSLVYVNGTEAKSLMARYLLDVPCVWPGDANNNGVADNNDILSIGLAFGGTGTARADQTITWDCKASTDWIDALPNGINLKYSDCNGNGAVAYDDTLAVTQNHGLTHPKAGQINLGGSPNLYLVFPNDTLSPGSTVDVQVMLGSDTLPVNTLYGIAYSIDYDASVIDTSSVRFKASTGWMGTMGTDLLSFGKNLSSQDRIDCAVTRIDQSNTGGYGQIGTLHFKIKDGLIGVNPLNLSTSGIHGIDNGMNDIPINGSNTSADVIATGIDDLDAQKDFCTVYPNPAQNELFIQPETTGNYAAVLFSVCGQEILNQQFSTNQTLNVKDLAEGVYFLHIQSANSTQIEKIVIAR